MEPATSVSHTPLDLVQLAPRGEDAGERRTYTGLCWRKPSPGAEIGVVMVLRGDPAIRVRAKDVVDFTDPARVIGDGEDRPWTLQSLFNNPVPPGAASNVPFKNARVVKTKNMPPQVPFGAAAFRLSDRGRSTKVQAIMRVWHLGELVPVPRHVAVALVARSGSTNATAVTKAVERAFQCRGLLTATRLDYHSLGPRQDEGVWEGVNRIKWRLHAAPATGLIAFSVAVDTSGVTKSKLRGAMTHAAWNLCALGVPGSRVCFEHAFERYASFTVSGIKDVKLGADGTGVHGTSDQKGTHGGFLDGVPVPVTGGFASASVLRRIDSTPTVTADSQRIDTARIYDAVSPYTAHRYVCPVTGLSSLVSMRGLAAAAYNNLFCVEGGLGAEKGRATDSVLTLLRSFVRVSELGPVERAAEAAMEAARSKVYSDLWPRMRDAIRLRSWNPRAPQRHISPGDAMPITTGLSGHHNGKLVTAYLFRAYLTQLVLSGSSDAGDRRTVSKCRIAMNAALHDNRVVSPSESPSSRINPEQTYLEPEMSSHLESAEFSPMPDLNDVTYVPKEVWVPSAPRAGAVCSFPLSTIRQTVQQVVSPSGTVTFAPSSHVTHTDRYRTVQPVRR